MRTSARDACGLLGRALDRFATTCEAVPSEVWIHRPSPESWNVADVAEHVSIANVQLAHVFARLADPWDSRETCVLLDEEIPYLFFRGGEPGDVARPTGAFVLDRTRFQAFADTAARIRTLTKRTTDDLRRKALPHPVFGWLDGIQWILLAAAHTERHRSQIIGLSNDFASVSTKAP